jgi:hypothetical protein
MYTHAPFFLCCLFLSSNHREKKVEICNLLLQYGADPTAVAGGATGGMEDDDSIVVYEMVDATAHASSAWIK